jgi:four helix bundle protein
MSFQHQFEPQQPAMSFPDEMKQRTKRFALRVIKMVDALPRRRSADVLGKQVLRSGTSVGANYRAACRARSNDEFRAKLGIVEEEADESLFWMELLVESGLVKQSRLQALMTECDEILSIVVSAIKTSRKTAPSPVRRIPKNPSRP